jgi:hypothetical protein
MQLNIFFEQIEQLMPTNLTEEEKVYMTKWYEPPLVVSNRYIGQEALLQLILNYELLNYNPFILIGFNQSKSMEIKNKKLFFGLFGENYLYIDFQTNSVMLEDIETGFEQVWAFAINFDNFLNMLFVFSELKKIKSEKIAVDLEAYAKKICDIGGTFDPYKPILLGLEMVFDE